MLKSVELWFAVAGGLLAASVPAAAAPAGGQGAQTQIAQVDLARPFGATSGWRLVATQGPSTPDDVDSNERAPGEVQVCVRRGADGACDPHVAARPPPPYATVTEGWDAHYLNRAEIVYPHGKSAPPLLLVQTASDLSGDGDQVVYTQLFAYRRAADQFIAAYGHATGHNNNQEDRFITSGPMQGDVISVEPTQNAPFGFWVTVSQLTPAYTYKQVLRFRSATHYGDGNPLAVINSEMPNIEQHLSLWRQGQPLPLPPGACPAPRLVKTELWCQAAPKN